MKALHISEGATAPPNSLAVDGPVTGAEIIYSHWQGEPNIPDTLLGDTSSEMLLRAAGEPDLWLKPYRHVVIGHLDTDGLLAAAIAVNPDIARRHGGLLVDAATSGDFQTWRGEPAYRLMLTLHRKIHEGPTPQAVVDDVVGNFAEIIKTSVTDPTLNAAVASTREAFAGIHSGRIGIHLGVRLATISWDRKTGHDWDPFLTVGAPDDLPLHILGAIIPDDRFQLRIERFGCGLHAGLDAPRHSWARTIIRPTIPWPDLARRLVAAQRSTRLCAVRDLTEADIVARIMRKENFLIGMLNKGVLALHAPLPGRRRRLMLTKTLEWNLSW